MASARQDGPVHRRRHAALRALAAVRTAVAAPLIALLTLVLAVAVLAISFVRRDAAAIEGVIRLWSRAFLACAPATLQVEGRHLVDRDGQYVFVANHRSNFDIPVMFLTAPVSIRYLAKKELYRIPLLAQAMNAMGVVKTDRGAGGRAHAAINEGIAAARRRGHSLIIFPEGTRSEDGRMATFKKGAFRIAIANGLPVVPVTIEGTWEMWPPGAKVFYPGRIKATVHEPIPTADLDLGDITMLRDRAHTAVAGALPAEQLPADGGDQS